MQSPVRWIIVTVCAALTLMGDAATLWAQAAPPAEQTELLPTRYAVAYGLVLLGIVLGITNVVRPGKRKGEKPKPQ